MLLLDLLGLIIKPALMIPSCGSSSTHNIWVSKPRGLAPLLSAQFNKEATLQPCAMRILPQMSGEKIILRIVGSEAVAQKMDESIWNLLKSGKDSDNDSDRFFSHIDMKLLHVLEAQLLLIKSALWFSKRSKGPSVYFSSVASTLTHWLTKRHCFAARPFFIVDTGGQRWRRLSWVPWSLNQKHIMTEWAIRFDHDPSLRFHIVIRFWRCFACVTMNQGPRSCNVPKIYQRCNDFTLLAMSHHATEMPCWLAISPRILAFKVPLSKSSAGPAQVLQWVQHSVVLSYIGVSTEQLGTVQSLESSCYNGYKVRAAQRKDDDQPWN